MWLPFGLGCPVPVPPYTGGASEQYTSQEARQPGVASVGMWPPSMGHGLVWSWFLSTAGHPSGMLTPSTPPPSPWTATMAIQAYQDRRLLHLLKPRLGGVATSFQVHRRLPGHIVDFKYKHGDMERRARAAGAFWMQCLVLCPDPCLWWIMGLLWTWWRLTGPFKATVAFDVCCGMCLGPVAPPMLLHTTPLVL